MQPQSIQQLLNEAKAEVSVEKLLEEAVVEEAPLPPDFQDQQQPQEEVSTEATRKRLFRPRQDRPNLVSRIRSNIKASLTTTEASVGDESSEADRPTSRPFPTRQRSSNRFTTTEATSVEDSKEDKPSRLFSPRQRFRPRPRLEEAEATTTTSTTERTSGGLAVSNLLKRRPSLRFRQRPQEDETTVSPSTTASTSTTTTTTTSTTTSTTTTAIEDFTEEASIEEDGDFTLTGVEFAPTVPAFLDIAKFAPIAKEHEQESVSNEAFGSRRRGQRPQQQILKKTGLRFEDPEAPKSNNVRFEDPEAPRSASFKGRFEEPPRIRPTGQRSRRPRPETRKIIEAIPSEDNETSLRIVNDPPESNFEPVFEEPRPAPKKFEAERDHISKKPNRKQQSAERYNIVNDDGSITWGYQAPDGSFKEETIGIDCITRGR